MKTPGFWRTRGVISTLLLPASWLLYGLTKFYRRRQARFAESVPVPVICVGNLTAGGAGKTPVALHIGAWMRERKIPAYFVSRGYGGTLQGPVLVNRNIHTASETGDEPLLLSQVLPTIVCKNRKVGAALAVQLGARAIILDDGFQNESLEKTLSIVVIDGHYGLGNGRLLPAGPLREKPRDALKRAQALVVIGPVQEDTEVGVTLPLLHARVKPAASADALRGKKVVAFCGIAYPDKFYDTLQSIGADIKEKRSFPDHYLYNERDLKKLASLAGKKDAILVTTEKDAARLKPAWRSVILTLPIELAFDKPDMLDDLLTRAAAQIW